MMNTIRYWLPLAVVLAAGRAAGADADLTPSQREFFESQIRPVLVDNCYKCHSAQSEKVKGGLLLDTKAGLLKGGDTGPAIIPGNPNASLLIKAIRYTDPDLQMPKKAKLADDAIAALETWVRMGAPDPRTESAAKAVAMTVTESAKSHWAWQPIKHQALPAVSNPAWCQTPVDNFILAKLDAAGLKPNPPADKRTLIRRATFDLIGLPPTPAEVDAFINDNSPGAFAKVVDRLLASPRYGERWGRHWLDVARYSDTKGQIRRNVEDPEFPFAWTYRDYVIRSFNEDKPYNVFIMEQIAADQLTTAYKNPTNLAALGFLTVGDRFMGMQNDVINDRIDVVTKGFLGLTVTCARCHDHKFDPIPQKDYYSLHGIFASCTEPPMDPAIAKIDQTPEFQAYFKQRQALGQKLVAEKAALPGIRKQGDKEAFKQAQRDMRETEHDISQLEMTDPAAPPRAMVLQDQPRPHDSPVFLRGDAGNRGELAPRRFLQVLSGPYRPNYTDGSGRIDLALDIASPKNPMTPRVMVNRIWLHHFGAGFVPTPDDFGMMSDPPSHPELLDYLSLNFMTNGWSIKKMHRLIMLSSVYQESCDDNPRFAQVDPGNRLLWHANIRRLEYEPFRDSLLAIGGLLDTNLFGRPVDLASHPDSTRRTVYGYVDRANIDDVLINFDFATPDMETGLRHQTTVPQQALYLMNSPLVIELSRRLAAMPGFTAATNDEARVRFLYERIYQRLPQPEEVALGMEFVQQSPMETGRSQLAFTPAPAPEYRANGKLKKERPLGKRKKQAQLDESQPMTPWQEYAQALLEGNETWFVN